MSTESNYLTIEIQLDNGETVYHQEFFTTDEKIAFNNFMKKVDLNDTGFLPVNEKDAACTININKIVKITPKGV
ncbi:hypothetical protein ROU88_09135 [Macrococcus capreoli]|uniref:hypothetical protein n=1 Tax=Macrococcus capreoli TaxID=2982690 RepID=UPI0021D59932|nr:hypothetical protein [Macrococcus sp. TMW 2.2395]MCU7557870.1 hypothetical protein [Macrococcus sp. TMW 2.2395]